MNYFSRINLEFECVMKSSSVVFLGFFLGLNILALQSCAAPSVEKAPNLKEVREECRQFDLSKDPEMAEACGIRQTRYKSYKNIPLQRFLVAPKNANLTLSDKAVELRLENTLPIDLPLDIKTKIDFTKEASLTFIKNKYIYKELYPTPTTRLKIFKIQIPTKTSEILEYCFRVPEMREDFKKRSAVQVNSLEKFECQEFIQLTVTK